jgi:protein TonB
MVSVQNLGVAVEGDVGKTQLAESSGHDSLDQAALKALAEARFTPAENDGTPVPVWIRVPVPFRP